MPEKPSWRTAPGPLYGVRLIFNGLRRTWAQRAWLVLAVVVPLFPIIFLVALLGDLLNLGDDIRNRGE